MENWCIAHRKQCFEGGSSSSSCKRHNEHDGANTMIIADHYIPNKLIKHRIVRGGSTPPQIQFLTEWENGWTSDITLAQNVIRKHPHEDLWFVSYRASWEPFNEYYDIITPEMINVYKKQSGITRYGFGFDEMVDKVSGKERQNLAPEEIHPTYRFDYEEVEEAEDDEDREPALRKKRGRPTKTKSSKKPRELKERNPDCRCGSSSSCIQSFDAAWRKKIRLEFQALTSLSTRSAFLSKLVELSPCTYT